MTRDDDNIDPKGLIREAYRIDGIGAPECRSIFLDWAIGVPLGVEARDLVRKLLDRHGEGSPEHPMTTVLRDALGTAGKPVRRGGAKARR